MRRTKDGMVILEREDFNAMGQPVRLAPHRKKQPIPAWLGWVVGIIMVGLFALWLFH